MAETTLSTGAELTAWRGRLGWSVQRAADELRVLAPSLRNLESGRKTASPALLRLAECLERLEGGAMSATGTAERRAQSRRARAVPPVPPVPSDPFLAALQRLRFGNISDECLGMLRAEVDRRMAGADAGIAGFDADYVAREAEWHAARRRSGSSTSAALGWCAELVERELPRA